MDKELLLVVSGLVVAFCALVGSITAYNLKTNMLYADLLKGSPNPVAVRCAWYGADGSSGICMLQAGRK